MKKTYFMDKQGEKHLIQAVLFDKDGTLTKVDDLWVEPTVQIIEELFSKYSSIDLTSSQYQEKLTHLGIVDGKVVANSIISSGSVMDLAVELTPDVSLSTIEIYYILNEFFVQYLKEHPEKIVPVCDLLSLFEDLKKRRLEIGIVTSDSIQTTMIVLHHLKILPYLSFIATPELFDHKPKKESLKYFSQHWKIPLDKMIYVGDSLVDMEYGKHSLASVGVLTGSTTATQFEPVADAVISNVSQIPSLFETYE